MTDDGACLGFLIHFPGKGVFDADRGKVEVSPEDATFHNTLLSKALIEGFHKNCDVGQGNYFFAGERISDVPSERGWEIKTWIGEVVATVDQVRKVGRVFTITIGDKLYRGTQKPDADCIFVERIK